MCDYIDSKDITSNKHKVDDIINLINDWSNRVPYHSYSNYGNRLDIEQVVLMPIYILELTTQYDKRLLNVKTVPYKGEAISEQQYDYPNEVNIWNYECEEPEEFVESMGDYHVAGSDAVRACYNCDGNGKQKCPTCDAKKIIVCPACGGKPKKRCPSCGGKRYRMQSCYHCSDGTYLNNSTGQRQRCSHCNGTGQKRERCSTCDGSGVTYCSKCSGAGKIDCPTCGKKGYIICTKCDGSGELRTFYEIHQELRFERIDQTHKHEVIIEYFPSFYIDREIEVPLIMDIRDRYYEINEFEMPDSIKKSLNDLLQSAANKLEDNEALHQQQLRIWRYDVFNVDYQSEGAQHSMLVDAASGNVYDPHGPIYSKMIELSDQAEELMKRKRYSAAIKKNSTALEMDLGGYLSFLRDLQEELSDKIMGSYMIGVWSANIPLAFIGYYFCINYFNEPHFYLEYFTDLFFKYNQFSTVFAHHMGIMFVFATLVVKPFNLKDNLQERFGYYITNPILRFLIGFTSMSWSSIYQLIVLVIINISGLTLISGFTFYGIYRLIQWLIQLF